MKKKVLFLIGALILGFGLNVGAQIYQTKQLELISAKEIQVFEVSTNDELNKGTIIKIEADIEKNEALVMAQTEVVEDTIYLMIYKWPAIKEVGEIEFDLESVPSLDSISQIAVIYGDPFSGEGYERGYSLNDLIDHPEQEIIWEKGGTE